MTTILTRANSEIKKIIEIEDRCKGMFKTIMESISSDHNHDG